MKYKLILGFICSLFFFISCWLVFDYFYSQHKERKVAFSLAKHQAKVASQKIENDVEKIMNLVKELSQDISDGKIPYDQVPSVIKNLLDTTPILLGLGVDFVPYKYQKDVRLFGPYFVRNEKGEIDFRAIEKSYDYSIYSLKDPDTRYYHMGIASPEGSWLEPFYGTSSKSYLTGYVKNFSRKDPSTQSTEVAGMIFAIISFDSMKKLLLSLNLGSTGYAFLLSKEGRILAHPNRSVLSRMFSDVASEKNDPNWQEVAKKAVTEKKEFYTEFTDSFTGSPSWVFFRPVSSIKDRSGWKLGLVINKEELLPGMAMQGTKIVWICASIAGFLFFLYLFLFPISMDKYVHWKWASAYFSVLSLLLILIIWNFAYRAEPKKEGIEILDRFALSQFIQQQETQQLKIPFYVPTGVFIQSVEFPTQGTVRVGGFVWQKYPVDFPYTKGISFPQKVGEISVETIFLSKEKEYTLICYQFSTTLIQDFKIRSFPFDLRNITIKIVPVEIDKNILLVPDLQSYAFPNPKKLPGIDGEVFIQGWSLRASYFSYKTAVLNANFGTAHVLEEKILPDLCFTINLKRHLGNVLFSYLPPLVIVTILLFLVLLLPKKKYDVTFGLSFSSFSLFILISAQTRFRESTGVPSGSYFEYFYFLEYLFVLVVILERMFYALNERDSNYLFNYQENLISKVIFWPMILGTFLFVAFLMLN
ncbi:MAG: hypothetical protein WCP39_04670 [Chlamydiota bacterium]